MRWRSRLGWVVCTTLGCTGADAPAGSGVASVGESEQGTETSTSSATGGTATSTTQGDSAASTMTSPSTSLPPTTSVDPDSSGSDTGTEACEGWRTELEALTGSDRESRELALGPQDTVIVIGWSAQDAYVFALDACDGTLLHTDLLSSDLEGDMAAGDIVIDGDMIFVSGGLRRRSGNGAYVAGMTYTRDDGFAVQWADEIEGNGATHDAWDIARGHDDVLWVVGSRLSSAPQSPAFVMGRTDGIYCGYTTDDEHPGINGRVVVDDDDAVYTFAHNTMGAIVSRYDANGCDCTGCPLDARSPLLRFDDQPVRVQDGLEVGGVIYASGWTNDDLANSRSLLAAFNPDGTLGAVVNPDNDALGDAYTCLASDGDALYAAGPTGFTGVPDLTDAAGQLDVYDVPLTDGAAPTRTLSIDPIGQVTGLAVESDGDGLYVVGAREHVVSVARCHKVDGC